MSKRTIDEVESAEEEVAPPAKAPTLLETFSDLKHLSTIIPSWSGVDKGVLYWLYALTGDKVEEELESYKIGWDVADTVGRNRLGAHYDRFDGQAHLIWNAPMEHSAFADETWADDDLMTQVFLCLASCYIMGQYVPNIHALTFFKEFASDKTSVAYLSARYQVQTRNKGDIFYDARSKTDSHDLALALLRLWPKLEPRLKVWTDKLVASFFLEDEVVAHVKIRLARLLMGPKHWVL